MGPIKENILQSSQPNSRGFKFWLVEPSKEIHDAETRQQSQLLSATLLVFLGVAFSGLVIVLFKRVFDGKANIYLIAVATFLLVFAYGLSRTRFNYIAGILALITLSLYPFGELIVFSLYDKILPTLIWLIVPLVLSTELLSLRNQALLALLDVMALVVLAAIGPQAVYHNSLLIAGLILSTAVILIAFGIYRKRMKSKAQSQYIQRIQRLESIRGDMERRVAEYAQSAAEFKADAEDAHRSLEAQTWQTTGLTELGKVMRGLQTIPSLASSIMKQVCRYADIPVGAFFLAEGETLRLVGGYAYPFSMSPTPRFTLGSGLVGEAALEQQVISMRDIPDNYLPITSGLGEATPAQILAVPCLYQEQVVGVMELASLEFFTPAQIQFLTASMEFIAAALHAAQIRTIIDALLIDTQHQTEALLVEKEKQQKVLSELDRREANLQRREKRLNEKQIKLNTISAEFKRKGSEVQDIMEASDAD